MLRSALLHEADIKQPNYNIDDMLNLISMHNPTNYFKSHTVTVRQPHKIWSKWAKCYPFVRYPTVQAVANPPSNASHSK